VDKKLKAAITGVLYFLQSQEKKKIENKWNKSGRKTIMDNRRIVQSNGIRR
jgi:hypothetical protein